MILLMFLLGGGLGLWTRYYFTTFAGQLSRDVFENYVQIFPENPPHFAAEKSILTPLKCGGFWRYFLISGGMFLIFQLIFSSNGIIYALYCLLLWIIARIDWHYRLISPTLCQLLLVLAIFSAWQNISGITPEQSLQSAAAGFGIFYGVYQLAALIYRQESFGRGDYWLIGALAAFMPWQSLPLFIFIACAPALIFAAVRKWRRQSFHIIPFAPFLCFSGFLLFFSKFELI